jgi:hypothetical protein
LCHALSRGESEVNQTLSIPPPLIARILQRQRPYSM